MRSHIDTISTAPDSPEVGHLAQYLEEQWHRHEPKGMTNYVPPEGDGSGGSSEGDGGSDGDEGGGSGDGDGDDGGDGDGDDEGDGEGDEGDDEGTVSKAALDAVKRRLANSEKKRKKAERDLKKRTDDEAEEAGEYKELYESEKARADDLEKKLKDGAFDRKVVEIATRLKYKNPVIAGRLLDNELRAKAVDEDGEVDEHAIERALKKLAKNDKYLVDEEKPQRTGSGSGNGDQQVSATSAGGDDGYEFDPRNKVRGAYARSGGDS